MMLWMILVHSFVTFYCIWCHVVPKKTHDDDDSRSTLLLFFLHFYFCGHYSNFAIFCCCWQTGSRCNNNPRSSISDHVTKYTLPYHQIRHYSQNYSFFWLLNTKCIYISICLGIVSYAIIYMYMVWQQRKSETLLACGISWDLKSIPSVIKFSDFTPPLLIYLLVHFFFVFLPRFSFFSNKCDIKPNHSHIHFNCIFFFSTPPLSFSLYFYM